MFQAFAIRVLQASASIEESRKLLGPSWLAAQDIMSAAVDRGLVARDTEGLTQVGMDEKSFGQGQDYVSVLMDIEGRWVLDVTPGGTRESADTLWKCLSEEQKDDVEAVVLDMWPAFLASAKAHIPQAKIVHNRFHIKPASVMGTNRARNTSLASSVGICFSSANSMWTFRAYWATYAESGWIVAEDFAKTRSCRRVPRKRPGTTASGAPSLRVWGRSTGPTGCGATAHGQDGVRLAQVAVSQPVSRFQTADV